MRSLIGLIWLLTSCTYHFTNEHVVRPEGIQTVAVEAVYDTSREVVPHEVLWESLQSAFAADGHLRLAPASRADALVRAHLRQPSIRSQGSELLNGPRRDPPTTGVETPPAPSEFPTLTQAGRYRGEAIIAMVVEVEVWSLRTRTLLLRQSYTVSEPFRAVHQTRSQEFTTAANDYLRFEEAGEAKFRNLSRTVARNVVRDLLIR